MSAKVKFGLFFGIPNLFAWSILYSMFGFTNEFNFFMLMFFSLMLVVGMFLSTKDTLWNELEGIYERRPLFKSGMATGILISLCYSFGFIILLQFNPELREGENVSLLQFGAFKLLYGMFFTAIYALVFPFMHKMNPAVKQKQKNN